MAFYGTLRLLCHVLKKFDEEWIEILNQNVLVVCTYNRFDDLQRCLHSVLVADDRPSRILIVDGAGDSKIEKLCHHYGPEIQYFATNAGLTFQRNFALDMITDCELIFFLDDDTTVGQQYFSEVMKIFSALEVIGVGVTPMPYTNPERGIATRLLGRSSQHQGKLNKFGSNVGRYSGEGYSEWVPGCSMTYKFNSIGRLRFDLKRAGYGLGEDVDFSWRLGRNGPLYWSSTPTITHHLSIVNRYDITKHSRMQVHSVWMLYRDGVGNLRSFTVLFGFLVEFFYSCLKLLQKRDKMFFLVARGKLLGVYDVMLGRV